MAMNDVEYYGMELSHFIIYAPTLSKNEEDEHEQILYYVAAKAPAFSGKEEINNERVAGTNSNRGNKMIVVEDGKDKNTANKKNLNSPIGLGALSHKRNENLGFGESSVRRSNLNQDLRETMFRGEDVSGVRGETVDLTSTTAIEPTSPNVAKAIGVGVGVETSEEEIKVERVKSNEIVVSLEVKLKEIGIGQGMVLFGETFSANKDGETRLEQGRYSAHTMKRRTVVTELEKGSVWAILTVVLPRKVWSIGQENNKYYYKSKRAGFGGKGYRDIKAIEFLEAEVGDKELHDFVTQEYEMYKLLHGNIDIKNSKEQFDGGITLRGGGGGGVRYMSTIRKKLNEYYGGVVWGWTQRWRNRRFNQETNISATNIPDERILVQGELDLIHSLGGLEKRQLTQVTVDELEDLYLRVKEQVEKDKLLEKGEVENKWCKLEGMFVFYRGQELIWTNITGKGNNSDRKKRINKIRAFQTFVQEIFSEYFEKLENEGGKRGNMEQSRALAKMKDRYTKKEDKKDGLRWIVGKRMYKEETDRVEEDINAKLNIEINKRKQLSGGSEHDEQKTPQQYHKEAKFGGKDEQGNEQLKGQIGKRRESRNEEQDNDDGAKNSSNDKSHLASSESSYSSESSSISNIGTKSGHEETAESTRNVASVLSRVVTALVEPKKAKEEATFIKPSASENKLDMMMMMNADGKLNNAMGIGNKQFDYGFTSRNISINTSNSALKPQISTTLIINNPFSHVEQNELSESVNNSLSNSSDEGDDESGSESGSECGSECESESSNSALLATPNLSSAIVNEAYRTTSPLARVQPLDIAGNASINACRKELQSVDLNETRVTGGKAGEYLTTFNKYSNCRNRPLSINTPIYINTDSEFPVTPSTIVAYRINSYLYIYLLKKDGRKDQNNSFSTQGIQYTSRRSSQRTSRLRSDEVIAGVDLSEPIFKTIETLTNQHHAIIHNNIKCDNDMFTRATLKPLIASPNAVTSTTNSSQTSVGKFAYLNDHANLVYWDSQSSLVLSLCKLDRYNEYGFKTIDGKLLKYKSLFGLPKAPFISSQPFIENIDNTIGDGNDDDNSNKVSTTSAMNNNEVGIKDPIIPTSSYLSSALINPLSNYYSTFNKFVAHSASPILTFLSSPVLSFSPESFRPFGTTNLNPNIKSKLKSEDSSSFYSNGSHRGILSLGFPNSVVHPLYAIVSDYFDSRTGLFVNQNRNQNQNYGINIVETYAKLPSSGWLISKKLPINTDLNSKINTDRNANSELSGPGWSFYFGFVDSADTIDFSSIREYVASVDRNILK